MPATAFTNHSPRVWIGCLACYSNGILVGDWFDADIANDVTIIDVHASWVDSHDMYCEEIYCLDSENIPERGGINLERAQAWGDAYDELDSDHLWPAYCAWIDSGMYSEDSSGVGCVSDFLDVFNGQWDSFREFAYTYVVDAGLLTDVPDELVRYIDYDSFARDLQHDYTVMDAEQHGVYIFRNS
ncbi:Antirestriction protein (ArdA) [Corynebacterium capitovis DSM 44611]|uniref:antirestriction protein ArdA n=1 Tax=Corynebacterium capitovis TaxID=131081 RepID=UPI00037CF961|nr:antirestriction protein ArdA [Corynebacterium capitovis]WKD56894.1 Antirestriction protein (ArdA) [Corynebacterium capitovis DSM 44611]